MNYEYIKGVIFDVIVDKLGIDVDDFGLNSSYSNDLGADSLDVIELMIEFEQKFNIGISDEEFELFSRNSTVKDSIDFLCKKLNISIENKMKVKCINVRNFRNLTLNKEYEVVEESVDFYHVINDANSTQRYSKEYFEIVEEEIIEVVEPANELLIEDEHGVIEDEFSFKYKNENEFVMIDVLLNDKIISKFKCIEVAGNCGTWSISGINDLYENLEDKELFNQAINELILNIAENYSKACLVFSTNDSYDAIVSFLNENCSGSTDWFCNQNSDNSVSMWWFIINQEH